jgi:hypothetical protein
MKMTTKHRINALAVALAAFAMACADPASPNSTVIQTAGPLATVTDQIAGYPTGMTAGEVRLCKSVPTGDPAGVTFTFQVTVTSVLPAPGAISNNQVQIIGVPGSSVCTDVHLSTKNGSGLDKVVIVESAPAANWALTGINTVRIDDGPGYTPPVPGDVVVENVGTRTSEVYINNDMGRIITFINDFTPPATGCTYTKGWYRNNGSSTVIAVDGRTIAEAQAIFNATPGQPGAVTFGGNNTLLNLYQQFLAALNNLGGDANEDLGPAAVDAAIDAVQAGTGGTGFAITTTLTQTQMSALIETLSDFNEGTFAGWPHCDD